MSQRTYPSHGVPSADFLLLSEEERVLSAREAEVLARGAEVETSARQVQARLDEARALFQRLAKTSLHDQAEAAFLGSLKLVVPQHVASPATLAAFELRRKALAARAEAADAEEATVRRRAAELVEVERQIAALREQIEVLAPRSQVVVELPKTEQPPSEGGPDRGLAPIVQLFEPPPGSPLRRSKRYTLQAEITLSSQSNFITGLSGNISETGIFIATYETLLAAGSEVDLTINLPGRPALKVSGVVRWARQPCDSPGEGLPGMGICFTRVGARESEEIRSFLKERQPLFWSE